MAFAIRRLGDAVGVKHENVSGIESNSPLVVSDLFKNAQWKSRQFDFSAAPFLVQQGLRLAGIRHAQFLTALLPGCETCGHKPAFDAALPHNLIHLPQHFRGLQLLWCETPHNPDGHGTVESGSSTFAAYISQRNAQLLRPIAQKLIEIAADFARREIPGGHIQPVVFRRHRTQKCALDSLGRLQVAFKPCFVPCQLLVKPRVLQRDGEIGGQDGKRLHVVIREVVQLRTFQVQHADDLALVHHRNCQFRARLWIYHHVARIDGHIGNKYWLL